uniref:Uncharacterized protein n=1 Tax=Chromera velia CCMP2878 TaxID=1169474 RepID=A0A0G4FVU9_9ALVE|eukprot:Cvel_478.t1-p1 / transcript=Cvel_478.t1 / gene=Cvel_478 / organism=Chromera_velia_CCMP2878 / gene_product=hypothetical protein / transcript_product=hypothetical protein / location=Cvel_scaffold15:70388-72811(+) / protein_length=343 / sequence_SO=supercontig / SO=protein_coding / is_pseudo=false
MGGVPPFFLLTLVVCTSIGFPSLSDGLQMGSPVASYFPRPSSLLELQQKDKEEEDTSITSDLYNPVVEGWKPDPSEFVQMSDVCLRGDAFCQILPNKPPMQSLHYRQETAPESFSALQTKPTQTARSTTTSQPPPTQKKTETPAVGGKDPKAPKPDPRPKIDIKKLEEDRPEFKKADPIQAENFKSVPEIRGGKMIINLDAKEKERELHDNFRDEKGKPLSGKELSADDVFYVPRPANSDPSVKPSESVPPGTPQEETAETAGKGGKTGASGDGTSPPASNAAGGGAASAGATPEAGGTSGDSAKTAEGGEKKSSGSRLGNPSALTGFVMPLFLLLPSLLWTR